VQGHLADLEIEAAWKAECLWAEASGAGARRVSRLSRIYRPGAGHERRRRGDSEGPPVVPAQPQEQADNRLRRRIG
jgi:hypothetical protein